MRDNNAKKKLSLFFTFMMSVMLSLNLAGAELPDSHTAPDGNKTGFLFPNAINLPESKQGPVVFRFVLPEPATELAREEKRKKPESGRKDYPYTFSLDTGGENYAGAVTKKGQASGIQKLVAQAAKDKNKTTIKIKPEPKDVVEFVLPEKPDIGTIAIMRIKSARGGEWGFPVLLSDTELTEKNITAGFLLGWPLLQNQKASCIDNLEKNKNTLLLKEYEKKWKGFISSIFKRGGIEEIDKDRKIQDMVREILKDGEKITLLIYSAIQNTGKTAESKPEAGKDADRNR